jgi:hypothetical protein
MRSIIFVAPSALLALPLLAGSPPARADNDFMGQVQRFFGGNSNEDAYRRGREDEMRQQADREEHRARREREPEWSRYERDRDARH